MTVAICHLLVEPTGSFTGTTVMLFSSFSKGQDNLTRGLYFLVKCI